MIMMTMMMIIFVFAFVPRSALQAGLPFSLAFTHSGKNHDDDDAAADDDDDDVDGDDDYENDKNHCPGMGYSADTVTLSPMDFQPRSNCCPKSSSSSSSSSSLSSCMLKASDYQNPQSLQYLPQHLAEQGYTNHMLGKYIFKYP